MLYETPIFINKSIENVRSPTVGILDSFRIEDEGEIAWLFGGDSIENAEFALRSEESHPENQWTRILHREPENIPALAKAIETLRVSFDDISIASDWDDTPLMSKETLRSYVSRATLPAYRLKDTQYLSEDALRSQINSKQSGKSIIHWVAIDGAGLRVDRVASLVALVLLGNLSSIKLNWEHTADRVIVFNASRVVTDMRESTNREKQSYIPRHQLRWRYDSSIEDESHPSPKSKILEKIVMEAIMKTLSRDRFGRRFLRRIRIDEASGFSYLKERFSAGDTLNVISDDTHIVEILIANIGRLGQIQKYGLSDRRSDEPVLHSSTWPSQ